MKRVAQMTQKEAIAKIKKFDREHKECSQLPIIMRIDHQAKRAGYVTDRDLCSLYGADNYHGWVLEKRYNASLLALRRRLRYRR